MKQFIFKGRLTLSGVDFVVEAESLEEARERMKARLYDYYEIDRAEGMDSDIDLGSGAENV